MLLTSDLLAKRLEAVEAKIAEEFARKHSELFPEAGATFDTIAGGTAVFAGLNSPMTQAVGMGVNRTVETDEVDRLEDFYRRQNSPVNMELCPHADNSMRQELARRSYRMIEQTNTLVRALTPRDWKATPFNGVRIRQPRFDEFELLATAVTGGFLPEGETERSIVDLFISYFNQSSVSPFIAEVDDEPAGGGVVAIIDGVASLFATAILERFRGRGAQSALIQARLNFGIENGCDLAMVSAAPGSTSLRNMERQDFRIVYTRAKLFREV